MIPREEITRYHEAAHVLVARLLGLGVDAVSARPHEGVYGATHLDFATTKRILGTTKDIKLARRSVDRVAVATLAGPLAARRAVEGPGTIRGLSDRTWSKHGGGNDLPQARLLAEMTHSDDADRHLAALAHEANGHVSALWPKIERLAEALRHRRVLIGSDIDAAIAA